MTTATATAVSREVLEDRYEGLILDVHDGDADWTDLQHQLSDVLGTLAQRTARCHRDDVSPINEQLYIIIRDHIINQILGLGLGIDREADLAGVTSVTVPHGPILTAGARPNIVDDNSIEHGGSSGWNR